MLLCYRVRPKQLENAFSNVATAASPLVKRFRMPRPWTTQYSAAKTASMVAIQFPPAWVGLARNVQNAFCISQESPYCCAPVMAQLKRGLPIEAQGKQCRICCALPALARLLGTLGSIWQYAGQYAIDAQHWQCVIVAVIVLQIQKSITNVGGTTTRIGGRQLYTAFIQCYGAR